ncbi:FKBP-type peptidyl-prolyl cis-trans isomerase N-terminal domain-containing protein [Serratia fonticola]|uniref:FKBP-type peptidyl-prolyl cis-trans isomerase N-terminal domain-containing protein n=1 Tax=Serratia fonticola TaxID=47917 RepID=UPI002DBFAE63|nr:FKBP-type peptidyl-prolyl cis-trans isomerase N-terminal domain-containing protein [Serratia fonticola]MEB7884021.1 FKBP-type peptidyl-prolyl cis-trans isomerase [Serratia fonticola]
MKYINACIPLLMVLTLCARGESPSDIQESDSRGLSSLGEILQSEEGAPALLGVVKVQNEPVKSGDKQKKKDAGAKRERSALPVSLHSAEAVELLQQQTRLKAQVAGLTATIAALNTRLEASIPKADLEQAQLQLKASQAETDALQKQIARQGDVRAQQDDQARQLATSTASLRKAQDTITALQQQADRLAQEKQAMTTTLEASTRAAGEQGEALAAREKALSEAQEALVQAKKEAKTATPVSPVEVRDYAVGASLAADALSLLKERAAQGVAVDQSMALAGIRDSFAGKLAVPQAVLDKALADSVDELTRKQGEGKAKNEQAGDRYRKSFAAKPGVKKGDGGVLYRIDYAGASGADIADTDMVSVVMSESLTDGTVIKDMEASGKFIRQPLSAYPPLFRQAIRQLKNHGSLTMVVPPALAYGDAGYPPLVPPGATMVYALRIRDVGNK